MLVYQKPKNGLQKFGAFAALVFGWEFAFAFACGWVQQLQCFPLHVSNQEHPVTAMSVDWEEKFLSANSKALFLILGLLAVVLSAKKKKSFPKGRGACKQ